MTTILTSPPPPRVHDGDSDPDMDEALRRVREKRSALPQLPPSSDDLVMLPSGCGFVAAVIANADTLSTVRRAVGAVSADREVAETAQLVVSELVSNAVRACGDGALLLVEAHTTINCVTVAVHDSRGDLLPSRAAVSDDAECGRGLMLLDVLAPGWTTGPSPLGKQVRCHIAAVEPSACDWCGQGDHDPIKPQDGELSARS